MVRISAAKGMIRKVTIGNKVNVSPNLATNSLGWEVQQYSHERGWTKVQSLPTVPTKGVAEMMKEEMEKKDREYWGDNPSPTSYRVYEALAFPL